MEPLATNINPSPPPIDMEALCAFNPDIASQALAQLYQDGHKDLALKWAPRLDIFRNAHFRESADHAASSENLIFGGPQRQSLFELAVSARDQAFLSKLTHAPAARTAIFTTRFDDTARRAAEALADDPRFSVWLLDNLEPAPRASGCSSSYDDSGICEFARQACKLGRLDLLARADALRRVHEGRGLHGWTLCRECFLTPLDRQGIKALVELGSIHDERLNDVAKTLYRGESPDDWAYGRKILELDFKSQIERTKVPVGDPKFSQTYANSALYTKTSQTPASWLGLYLEHGLKPFKQGSDGSRSVALALLSANWRDDLPSKQFAELTPSEQGSAMRTATEDLVLPLLNAMLSSDIEGLEEKIDVASLGRSIAPAFAGARKVDLLCLCVAQGYNRCARAIVDAGADWKFAAKQCENWLIRPLSNRYDSPHFIAAQRAFFEALSLRKTSETSTARRDAKSKAAPPPPLPNRQRL